MKKLAIEWGELELAFDNSSYEFDYYLDTETGQVLMVTDEARRDLARIYEQYSDVADGEVFDLAAVLPQTDLQDWQQHAVMEAHQVKTDSTLRYLEIPGRESSDSFETMQDFIFTIENERLEARLQLAINGRRPFRSFKDVLSQYPDVEERWYHYQDARLEGEVREWLEMEDIEPTNKPGAAESPAEEYHPIRQQLLDEVLWFTQAASRIHGVTRIALIGSLTTDKADPKDIDMLVTITPEVDLKKLATLGRKLQGHMQNIAHGGELFLADTEGSYLGRTCPWKQCGPGIRMSCDALHCGRWQYLHDDFDDIKLSNELIAAPPIQLWPQVISRVPVPVDVAQLLQHF